MSNIFPLPYKKIPSEEDEQPARYAQGVELKNPAYHCRPKDLWPKGVASAEQSWLDAMQLYLANFARPIRSIADEIKCLACNTQVTGHHVIITDWRHRTKLKYSPEGTMEGSCTNCGYPARLKHDIYLGQQLLVSLKGFPLFYHPSATERS